VVGKEAEKKIHDTLVAAAQRVDDAEENAEELAKKHKEDSAQVKKDAKQLSLLSTQKQQLAE